MIDYKAIVYIWCRYCGNVVEHVRPDSQGRPVFTFLDSTTGQINYCAQCGRRAEDAYAEDHETGDDVL